MRRVIQHPDGILSFRLVRECLTIIILVLQAYRMNSFICLLNRFTGKKPSYIFHIFFRIHRYTQSKR